MCPRIESREEKIAQLAQSILESQAAIKVLLDKMGIHGIMYDGYVVRWVSPPGDQPFVKVSTYTKGRRD